MATRPATNRILVVEDDPSIRKLVTTHFRRSGFEVEYAIAAEEVASDERYDVVLTDVHLPGESGLEMARRIHEARPDQPVVFITGDSDPGIARAALSYGAAGYLLKPFELFELDAAVNSVVTRKRRVQRIPQALPVNRLQGQTVLHHIHVTARRPVLISPAPHHRRNLAYRVRMAAAVTLILGLAWAAGWAIKPASLEAQHAAEAADQSRDHAPVVVPVVVEKSVYLR